MSRLHSIRPALFDAATRLLGFECNLYPETSANAEPRQTTSPGFFSFERHTINAMNTEDWGLGFYLMTSRLRVHPQV